MSGRGPCPFFSWRRRSDGLLVPTPQIMVEGLPDHVHSSTAGQGGQLDWDDIFSDAVHSHQSDAEGGTIEAGSALLATGATDGHVLTADGANGCGFEAPAGGGIITGTWSSTSWDGDAKNGASGVIDLSAAFSLPASISAVAVRLTVIDETVAVLAALSSTSANVAYSVIARTQVANQYIDAAGIVPCDSNGDIYFTQNGELDEVYIYIMGYWE